MSPRSESAYIPATASAVLLLVILASWGFVYYGGMPGVYSWTILIPVTVPVLGFFAFPGMLFYAYKYRSDWAFVGLALSLSLAAMYPALWMFGIAQRAYPATPASTRPAATVRLPSDLPLVVLWGGNGYDTNYHAATVDERWAYDFAIEPVLVGSRKLEDFGCFGTDIVSPVNAEVWSVVDGREDNHPNTGKKDDEQPLGNHMVLKLSGGTYLILAHMQKGSVTKKANVKEGDVLGRCGNSGDSAEPHIHIHHQRQDPKTNPPGFAEGLPLYFRGHDGNRMPRGGIVRDGDRFKAIGDRVLNRQ